MTLRRLPSLQLDDGSVELLKWIALVLMTGDHVDKYLFNGTIDLLFNAGRLALPLFVSVLAYNLARPGALSRRAYQRASARLLICGVVSSVPFLALGGLFFGWYPLNVLFTLLALTWTLYFLDRGGLRNATIAAAIFIVAGSAVEFWWPAIALGVAVWFYARRPSWAAASAAVASCAALSFINGNQWALAALVVLALASQIQLAVPRLRWIFYAYYPAHLVALWLVRIPMAKAGYLFI